ncbi:zinc ribbon domain-containing protein [Micromonospora sp. NPDC005806]|uniref:zinc ribbon domain-containing protein n=1 Tax=Micromonospora sp. NPDC005806 TaxID=3364234 RepID=UPI00368DA5D1
MNATENRLTSGGAFYGRRSAWPRRAQMTGTADPYLLRTLLWCGPCDVPMHPHPGRGQRTYKCPLGCRKVELPAEAIERVTWTAAERRATLSGIAPPFRQSVLEQLLVKVVVRADAPSDLHFTWRT